METPRTSGGEDVSAAFKDLESTVVLKEREFHSVIDYAKRPKTEKKSGIPSLFSACVIDGFESVVDKLRTLTEYTPIFLTDDEMGITKYAALVKKPNIDSNQRARYRSMFRDEVASGVHGMCIHAFGIKEGGKDNPSCIFIWRIPTVRGPQHDGNVARAITRCREEAPKKMSAEAIKHFNIIFNQVSQVSAKVRDALREYLYKGMTGSNIESTAADEYCQLVMDLAAGLPIDESLLPEDGRSNNSRGGQGIGATKFIAFWEACAEVLNPTLASEERRNSSAVYSSVARSIPDLINQAVDALEIKVKDGRLKEMVSIPSIEWVRLSFIPNNAFVESASKFTGRLLAKRCVQTRNLRKQHIDQHWVNAMTLYVLEWLVELKRLYDRVEFFGQDDKAKVAVGDAVPVSTGVRAKSRGIARAGEVDSPGLRAMDHDFHTANLIPSVTLRCNIPDIISGSFFSGGDDGFGQIFVTIHDAIFEPSKVYNHTAQLIDVIVKLEVAPAVLTLQTDCGGDHSIKRVATQLA